MARLVIERIIENFNQQISLYQEMDILSAAQLSLLENSQPYDEINQVLLQRALLLDRIRILNEDSRILQQQAVEELGIDAFVLPRLKICLPAEEIDSLSRLIDAMSTILRGINDKDNKTQHLMAQRRMNPGGKIGHGNPAQARQAYQQASQTTRTKPDKNKQ